MEKQYKMTQEHLTELEKELHHLKTVRVNEIAEQIKEARGFGDLSENSEYDEAKNEQGKAYSRIAELEDIIANAVIITEGEGHTTAEPGSTVTVTDLETGEREQYEIVGSQEANPGAGRVSDESPFGKAVLGLKAGDEFVVEAPKSRFRYRLEEIK